MIFSAQQKRDWNETFNDVSALYQVHNEGRGTLRAKQVSLNADDEVEALPIDFLIDVELKAARVLPAPLLDMFMRLAEVSQMVLLPDAAKLLLGRVWAEYGLGVEGAYRKLYYNTKNEQIRNYMKGKADAYTTGAINVASDTVEPEQFN